MCTAKINDLPSMHGVIKYALLIRNIDDQTGSGEFRLNVCKGTCPIAEIIIIKLMYGYGRLYTSVRKPFVIEKSQ